MAHRSYESGKKSPAATILYGVEIPSSGGATSVADMRAAYRALPEAEQAKLRGPRTVNTLDDTHDDTRPDDVEKYGKPVLHPMVRTHPIHGSDAVYFHITKTKQIEGMTHDASRAYLQDLRTG